jgi:hypothetical protein
LRDVGEDLLERWHLLRASSLRKQQINGLLPSRLDTALVYARLNRFQQLRGTAGRIVSAPPDAVFAITLRPLAAVRRERAG